MKKLLIVGSDSIHIYNYIELIKEYFDDILLITNKKRNGSSVRSLELDFRLTSFSRFKTVKVIREVIKDYNPSVIHIHQANSYAYYTLKASKNLLIPKIVTAWGSDILLMPNRNWLLKQTVRYNLSKADMFTADSEYLAIQMQKLLPDRKLKMLIANFGIEILDLNLEKENIIYSNRLHKKLYRIDKVIEIFNSFITKSTDKSWKLVIAATGEETESLKMLVVQLGISEYVQFVGWVDKNENAKYYSKAKIFISIPESDATAMSLLESMAYGCIPVLSNLPANKEWIEDGKNGIIVSDLNSNVIERALKLDLDSVALFNKDIIEKKGTKTINSKKFIQMYDQLLDSNK